MSEHLDKLRQMSDQLIDVDGEIALLRGVLANVPIAIVGADVDGRINYFNPAAQAMFFLSEREAIGQPLTVLMPERYRQPHLEAFEQARASGLKSGILVLHGHGLRGDGKEFPIVIRLQAQVTSGKVSYTAAIREDDDGP